MKKKIKDVKNLLLKQFGENWFEDPQLTFYRDIFESKLEQKSIQEENEREECDCLVVDHAIHI